MGALRRVVGASTYAGVVERDVELVAEPGRVRATRGRAGGIAAAVRHRVGGRLGAAGKVVGERGRPGPDGHTEAAREDALDALVQLDDPRVEVGEGVARELVDVVLDVLHDVAQRLGLERREAKRVDAAHNLVGGQHEVVGLWMGAVRHGPVRSHKKRNERYGRGELASARTRNAMSALSARPARSFFRFLFWILTLSW